MKKYIYIVIPLLLVLGLNIYFRTFPIAFPQLTEQARGMVSERIRQQATQEVYVKFPQYDPLAKEKLVKARIDEYRAQAKAQMEQQAADIARQMRARYQDENNQTYLMELDCWHWARYTENVVYQGYPGDEIRDGKQFDVLMLAPEGLSMPWGNFLFYLSAFLYKVFLFFKFVPLFTFLFYLPIFFASLLIVTLYFFSFRLGKALCAVIACLFVGLAANFIPRSCAGWFDKDVLNLLFPLLIIWPYAVAYGHETVKKRMLWVCIAGFATGLFGFTWENWWFIFLIVIMYEMLSIILLSVVKRDPAPQRSVRRRQHYVTLAAYLGFTLLWLLLFCGIAPLRFIYDQVREAIILSNPMASSMWPNVFSTVGELKKATMREVVESAGGLVIFIPAVASIIAIFIRGFFLRSYDAARRCAAMILCLWFLVMLFACFQGVRFVVFLGVPVGILFGWGVSEFYGYIKTKNKIIAGLFAFLVLAIVGGIFVPRAQTAAKGSYPLMHDGWYKVLTIIRDTTPPDSVINSWWDFGDWFKVVGQRKVIFDGQSQNRPQAYWMAKAILSNNEQESLGILRMLNNGANKAFTVIDGYLKDPLRSILLLETAIPVDLQRARQMLSDFLPARAVDEVILLLFDKPGNAYFFVDYSMIYKITAISYLGNWNFSKVYIAQNINKKEKAEIIDYLVKLGKNKDEMERLYQEAFLISGRDLDKWVSRPVQFYSGVLRGTPQGNTIFFNGGMVFNTENKSAYTIDGKIPRSVFYQDGDMFREVVFQNANMAVSFLVYKANNEYRGVLLDRELANSLFVKLYFLKGKGLAHFKTHIDAEEGENYLGSFKIEW
ncbi:MAG: STT3 domain-containing protein [Candidatus Omnitrophota bacterium]